MGAILRLSPHILSGSPLTRGLGIIAVRTPAEPVDVGAWTSLSSSKLCC